MTNQTSIDTTDEVAELLDSDLANIKRKSVSGALTYFGRTIILQVIGIVTTLILGVYLTPSDFGIYGIVIQIIGLLNFFSDVGLAASLIQKKTAPTLSDLRSAFTVQQILGWLIVIIAMVLVVTGFVSQKTGEAGNWILMALALSFPLTSLKNIPSILLERDLEFSKLVVPQIFEKIVFNAVMIYCAWRGFGAYTYAYAIMLQTITGVIVMYFIKRWPIGLELNRDALKSLMRFGIKFQLNDLIARLKDNLSYLMLGFFLPLNEFGYIQWAKSWSMFPYNLTVQNVISITFPTFSRLQGNTEALKKAIEKTIFFVTVCIFPLLVGMSVLIEPLTHVIPRYAKWQPALICFVLFTLDIGWAAMSTPLTNTLNALGKINTTLKLMVMWTILTWILTPLGIWFFGFQGVAVAAAVIAVSSVLPIMYVKRLVPIEVWPQVWRQLLSAIVMGLVGVLGLSLWRQNWLWFASGGIVMGLTYLVTLAAVGYAKVRQEFESLRSKA